MYTKFWWLVVVAISLFVPTRALAHNPGEPAAVRINDTEVLHNPINFSSLPDLGLTEELAPAPYLVNADIAFSVHRVGVPLLAEDFPLYTFTWNFGEQTSKTGESVTHVYPNPGSYTATLSMQKTGTPEASIPLASIRIHIVPTENYELPDPVLTVNGQPVANTITDSIPAAFTRRVILDASKSRPGSAKIASFTWDLGNRQMARDKKVTVTYENLFSTVQPVVRITDANNLTTDATVELTNASLPNPDGSIPASTDDSSQIPQLIAGIALLLSPTAVLRYLRKTRRT